LYNDLENDMSAEFLYQETVEEDQKMEYIEQNKSKINEENAEIQSEVLSAEERNFVSVLTKRITTLENQLRTSNKINTQLRKNLQKAQKYQKNFEAKLSKYYGEDQLEIIRGKIKVKWLPETISKALFIRKKGRRVLDAVRNFFAPLPSLTTVNRHVSMIKFLPGIIDFNIQMLAKKCESLKSPDDIFFLVFDETAIVPGRARDPSSNLHLGGVTLPVNPDILANQLLLFLVMGIGVRIKEIVAFHFTKSSVTKGNHLTAFIFELICEIENKANIKISGISFDLSALNCSVMKEMGIKFNLANKTYYVQHPNRPNNILLLNPDGNHCSRNLNQGQKNDDVIISNKMRKEYALDAGKSKLSDVEKIFKKDANHNFKLMPHVTDQVVHTAHYAKMNPQNAVKFHSMEVQSALEYAKKPNQLVQSTSFVLSALQKYHSIINSTESWKLSDTKKFEEDKNYLEWFANYFLENITIGKGNKKSIYGARMGIYTNIHLAQSCFDQNMKEYFPSRTLSNAIENKFSILRDFTATPNAVQCCQTLRTMCLTPFQQKKIGGKYVWDEKDPTKSNYLDDIKLIISSSSNNIPQSEDIILTLCVTTPKKVLWSEVLRDKDEFNAFVCHLSLLLNKIIPKINCKECHDWIIVEKDHSLYRLEGYKLLAKRIGKESYKFTPSTDAVNLFLKFEHLYQKISSDCNPAEENFESSFIDNIQGEAFYSESHCFEHIESIGNFYMIFRIKNSLHCRFTQNALKLASKSFR
jgi:hypothetical protein